MNLVKITELCASNKGMLQDGNEKSSTKLLKWGDTAESQDAPKTDSMAKAPSLWSAPGFPDTPHSDDTGLKAFLTFQNQKATSKVNYGTS